MYVRHPRWGISEGKASLARAKHLIFPDYLSAGRKIDQKCQVYNSRRQLLESKRF